MLTFYPELSVDKNKEDSSEKPKKGLKEKTGDFIFLIDQSHSMEGAPITIARQAAIECLETLGEGCRVNLIGFGSSGFAAIVDNAVTLTTTNKHFLIDYLNNDCAANMGGTGTQTK